ncbi:NRT1 PTR FAMILY -like [Olea europaea subsp. europaea]|uniref:NRT1 PTR FAMILY -like n=1 Tax=Olea europaea subsp. europaea TaxID=158383 RepID=A0A8S0RL25_OLEEU|nr:NRT1 PTR FAMILY -like [Olea europaea subsp. europaea]
MVGGLTFDGLSIFGVHCFESMVTLGAEVLNGETRVGLWTAEPIGVGTWGRTERVSVGGYAGECISNSPWQPDGRKMSVSATHAQTTVCFLAFYLLALGTGGIKPFVSSYGADQFDDTHEAEKKFKSSFFRFGIPAVAMAIRVTFFFSGTRLYQYQKPGGNLLTRLCKVVVAALRRTRVVIPDGKSLLYKTSNAESVTVGSRELDHTGDVPFYCGCVFNKLD